MEADSACALAVQEYVVSDAFPQALKELVRRNTGRHAAWFVVVGVLEEKEVPAKAGCSFRAGSRWSGGRLR